MTNNKTVVNNKVYVFGPDLSKFTKQMYRANNLGFEKYVNWVYWMKNCEYNDALPPQLAKMFSAWELV